MTTGAEVTDSANLFFLRKIPSRSSKSPTSRTSSKVLGVGEAEGGVEGGLGGARARRGGGSHGAVPRRGP